MNNLIDLEKKINSELTTKIKKSEIKHNQLYLNIETDDLIDVSLFIKNNENIKFRQLIDITVVDYPENTQRFKVVYLFLSHEFNQRIILSYYINDGFEGHPLRKDFPLTGHTEVRYSEEQKKVINEPVKLEQNYRNFDYESPWEGTKYIKNQTKQEYDKEK